MPMEDKSTIFFFLSLLLLPDLIASAASNSHPDINEKRAAYIVYLGEHRGDKLPLQYELIEANHHSYLQSVKDSEEEAKTSLIYSYKHSINGFAAILTEEEATKLRELDEVVSVIRSKQYSTHTTRSWEFSGVQEDNPRINDLVSRAKYGKDVIVGMLDSGVWPESKSFSDKGMGPIPESWKGICQTGPGFKSCHCNRKIIGARYYLAGYESHYGGRLNETEDYRSPRDKDGHGSHTASIAGGQRVYNVSAFGGVARGTASGGAPMVRLAIYKVCWVIPNQIKINGNVCFDTDVLAAMDDAIADGVDVLSLSIGKTDPYNYTDDGLAIGALHAVKNDIVVSCSAGNSGPSPSSLSNIAPWIITVGASTLDREFSSSVILRNGLKIKGISVAPVKLKKTMYPLVYAGDIIKPHVPQNESGLCLAGSLLHEKTKGKIVLCYRGEGISRYAGSLEVKRSGGVGLILGNVPKVGHNLHADPHFVPATAVSYEDANIILKYIKSRRHPKASISPPTTVYGSKPAPAMADFSSRGPNTIDPYFLKPDITAPGVSILAAWTEEDSPTKLPKNLDPRIVKYNLHSGTSMSCPHVSAAAALLRAIHPSWSNAAIRSALMTTATTRNKLGNPITDGAADNLTATPFAYGSGHFRPSTAADPGLVYDANYTDYLNYLCGIGMNGIDPTFKCPAQAVPPYNLNYPSIAIPDLRVRGTVAVQRTVTNVGGSRSVYLFYTEPPAGVSVKASPNVLYFDGVGQKKSFTITLTAISKIGVEGNGYSFGRYSWSDGIHHVRSPIAVA